MNSSRLRQGFVYLLIILAIVAIVYSTIGREEPSEEWSMTDVAVAAAEGRIEEIRVSDSNNLTVLLTNEETVTATKDPGATAPQQLAELGVTTEELADIEWVNEQAANWDGIFMIAMWILPLLIVVGVIFFMMRQAQGSNNQAMSFGKSRARMFTGEKPTVTFDDVAGCDEAKEELNEVVEFLQEPAKFIQLGARIPKGVLLVGPPGTGKTLMAKAVSGEAGVPFFSISGSEFVEMFVGVGASRVRDLFEQAKRHSPCIVFIDEVDAVGRQRGAGLGGSHDEREQTLNQILVEMDGFDTDTNVIIIAATNRPDILDPALLRPGRFDRRVILDRPDVGGREEILAVHVLGKPIGTDVDLKVLARATPGFVGADLENMVNEAAILAARRNKKTINMAEFQEAIERIIAGPERRSRIIKEEERKVTAYHEAGHAMLSHLLPYADPVLKVTIVPRGMAGGYMMPLKDDIWYYSREKLMDEIVVALGGRIAEELTFDQITTGASSDLEKVTKLARDMVTRYGMSDKLGPMIFGQKQEMVFLGREIGEQRDYSEAVAEEIDSEVRRIVSEAYERGRQVMTDNREQLEAVAQALLTVETLTRVQFEAVMNGEAMPEPSDIGTDWLDTVGSSDDENEEEPEASQGISDNLDMPPAPSPA